MGPGRAHTSSGRVLKRHDAVTPKRHLRTVYVEISSIPPQHKRTISTPRPKTPHQARADDAPSWTPSEIVSRERALCQREQSLLCRERECTQAMAECVQAEETLAEQNLALAKRTSALKRHERGHRDVEAKSIMQQLDDSCTCSLCFDVLAYPCQLNTCGHTFCALCILKWYFSKLHRPCGMWHERVECPICRVFCTAITEGMLARLADLCLAQDLSCGGKTKGGVKLRAWQDDPNLTGPSKAEWIDRAAQGRHELESLRPKWGTIGRSEFIAIKARLGV